MTAPSIPELEKLLAYANGLAEIDPAFGKARRLASLLSRLSSPSAEMIEAGAAEVHRETGLQLVNERLARGVFLSMVQAMLKED